MKVTSLQELIEIRKHLIDAHNENDGFADGIRALLTDLYPDTAHFIYELLQNAEDMTATKVRFYLKKNELLFAHNGTKRDFNLQDIDAITSIGSNAQKRNDPTSIGKFGVGFKAVFSYTATPEVHSGNYDFKIIDYFLPSIEGVAHMDTYMDDEKWTCFVLPFNNPKKPANQAHREILDGLQQLDDSSILFLKNIRSIEFILPDGTIGYVKTLEPREHVLEICCKKQDQTEVHSSFWLRFLETIETLDEQGKNKRLNIGVSYHLLPQSNTTNPYSINPVKGKTFIYFPATKEESNLKFHINAPFASTVARDSIRECKQNQELLNKIADLTVKSLAYIKASNMLSISFLAALPNDGDELSDLFSVIAKKIYHAFSENAYVPTYPQGFERSGNVLRSVPVSIRNVFPNDIIGKLTNSKKVWSANPPPQSQREDRFLKSLGIEEFDYAHFACLFKDELRSKTEEVIQSFSDSKLRDFYLLLYKCKQELSYSWELKNLGESFINTLLKTTLVKTTIGFRRPTNAYILPINQTVQSPEVPIIPIDLYDAKNINYNMKSDILALFNCLGIKEYGIKTEIEKLLRMYKNNENLLNERLKSKEYFSDLVMFGNYRAKHSDIDFSDIPIVIARRTTDKTIYRTKASEVIFGEPFASSIGQDIASITKGFVLWEGYNDKNNLSAEKLEIVMDFFAIIGVRKGLIIQQTSATKNPDFWTKLNAGGKYTGYGENCDYSIADIDKLLSSKTTSISLEIWNTLIRYQRNTDILTAKYSPNRTATCNYADSTLVYYLKKLPWIPTLDGTWKCPAETSTRMLLPDFKYSDDNKVFKAIGFDENQRKTEAGRQFAEDAAKKAGGVFISQEDLPDGLTQEEIKNVLKQYSKSKLKYASASEQNQQVDLRNALIRQNRDNSNSENENDILFSDDDGAVPNIKRRTSKLTDSFIENKDTPKLVKMRMQRIADSNADEREHLEADYKGECQICKEKIISFNGKRIFHAINIIDSSDLPASLANTFSLCWNSICLCPNCAAKYKHCAKNMDRFEEQVISAVIIEGDGRKIPVSIQLDGKECRISYTPRHLLALKTAIKLLTY